MTHQDLPLNEILRLSKGCLALTSPHFLNTLTEDLRVLGYNIVVEAHIPIRTESYRTEGYIRILSK